MKYGKNWFKIQEVFPGRDAIMIKNRYYSAIRNTDKERQIKNELENRSSCNEPRGLLDVL